jgi:hypothetical protein
MLACRIVIRVLLLAAMMGAGGCKTLGFQGRARTSAASALAGFEAVEVTGVTTEITVGDAFAVNVEGAKDARSIETRVKDGALLVSARGPQAAAHVRVVLPRLARVRAQAARVTVAGVKSDHLTVEGDEGSRIVVAGTVDVLECTLAGASRADARELTVTSAQISLAGASRLDLRPERAVSGQATGASKLAVWSKPKRIKVATRDSATVTMVR